MRRCRKILTSELLFLLLISLLILFAPHPDIGVTNNASVYLAQSVKLLLGNPPEILKEGFVARGPIFSYLLAMLFRITGPSVISAFLLMKLLYIAVLVSLFVLAKTYYGKNVGFLSVVFALSSIQMYLIGCSIDTNSLLVFFLLWFLIFLYRGLKEGGKIDYVLSAVFLSLSFLTKETAMVYLALIVGLVIWFWFKERSTSYNLVLLLFVFQLLLLPWIIYVYAQTHSVFPVLGAFNPYYHQQYSGKIGMDIGSNFFENLLPNSVRLYSELLATISFLSPLLLLGFFIHLIATAAKIIRGRDILADGLLLAAVVLYIPVPLSDIAIGASDPRQGFVIYCLLFVVLAKYCYDLWKRFVERLRRFDLDSRQISKLVIPALSMLLLVAVVGFVQFHSHPKLNRYIEYIRNYKLVPEIRGRYTSLHQKGARWIGENIPKGSAIVVDGYLGEILGFYTSYQYEFRESFQPVSCFAYQYRKPVVFLITYKNFRLSQEMRRAFWIMDEYSIIRDLNKGDIIAFSNKTRLLQEYFTRVTWATELYHNDDIYIYRIEDFPDASTFFADQEAVFINESFVDDLEWLKLSYPEEYATLLNILQAMDIDYKDLVDSEYIVYGVMF